MAAARPELEALCATLKRRYPRLDPDEIMTIGEDVLMREVTGWDPAGKVSLVQLARRRIKQALRRAAQQRAPSHVALAMTAMEEHGSLAEPLGLSDLMELTNEQIFERARDLGRDRVTVGYSAYAHARVEAARSPEEQAAAMEERDHLWRAVDSAGAEVGALYRFLYDQGMTLEAAAAHMGISVSSAKRVHARARTQIRAILSRTKR